jgi:KaiB domain
LNKTTLTNSVDHVRLAAFLDCRTVSSIIVKSQLKALQEEMGLRDDQITFYDVRNDIDKAEEFNVIACPTLVRVDMHPRAFLIGELKKWDLVKAFINLGKTGASPSSVGDPGVE